MENRNTIQRTNIRYSDIGHNLQIHPVRGDLIRLTNEDAVKRSIRNLLLTAPGERFFQPTLGAGLPQFLFENVSRDTADFIRERITETINYNEPRARLIRVYVSVNPDENSYSATIIFSTINNPEPITFNLILERVR
jgi:phage baseplate assembly protein W